MNGQKALAAEAIAALGIVTIARIKEQGKMIPPSQVAGVATAYTLLALVAMFGPNAARIAAGLSGLTALTLGVVHGGSAISGISGLANPKVQANGGGSTGPQIYQPGSGPAPSTKYPYTFDNNTVIPLIP